MIFNDFPNSGYHAFYQSIGADELASYKLHYPPPPQHQQGSQAPLSDYLNTLRLESELPSLFHSSDISHIPLTLPSLTHANSLLPFITPMRDDLLPPIESSFFKNWDSPAKDNWDGMAATSSRALFESSPTHHSSLTNTPPLTLETIYQQHRRNSDVGASAPYDHFSAGPDPASPLDQRRRFSTPTPFGKGQNKFSPYKRPERFLLPRNCENFIERKSAEFVEPPAREVRENLGVIDFDDITVIEVKRMLRHQGLPGTGKKTELIKKLKMLIENPVNLVYPMDLSFIAI